MTRIGILLVFAVVPLFLAACLWYTSAIERAPVARARLNTFARRHELTVTVNNGNQVIRYLATTRRWRATGLAAGLVVSIAWAARHGELRVDFLTLFVGWFAGALVAEFRVSGAPSGPRRAASLAPRVPTSYLPRSIWVLLPTAGAISVGLGLATLVKVLRGQPVRPLSFVLCGVGIVITGVVLMVRRAVLHRAQPVDAPDIVAADNAIRSRSLHVLTGGATSLVLYCALGQLEELPMAGAPGSALPAIGLIGVFAVALLGWLVARSHWPAPGPDGQTRSLAGDGAR